MRQLEPVILQYVKGCMNIDGGYSFCQGVDSNAQDTFFAISIQELLGVPPTEKEKTLAWLESFPIMDVRSLYYVVRSTQILGGKISKIDVGVLSGFKPKYDYTELTSSEIESIYMVSFALSVLKLKYDVEKISEAILSIHNQDGGFGIKGHSNLLTTNFAVQTLDHLGYDIRALKGVVEFVRKCEDPEGGFTSVPGAHLPFIEETYAGICLLSAYGQKPLYRENCSQQIMRCLTSRGGFSRAEFGIPTLENTYHAVFSLYMLGYR